MCLHKETQTKSAKNSFKVLLSQLYGRGHSLKYSQSWFNSIKKYVNLTHLPGLFMFLISVLANIITIYFKVWKNCDFPANAISTLPTSLVVSN